MRSSLNHSNLPFLFLFNRTEWNLVARLAGLGVRVARVVLELVGFMNSISH